MLILVVIQLNIIQGGVLADVQCIQVGNVLQLFKVIQINKLGEK